MANKRQKVRKTPSGEWVYCSISAHPEEVERWRAIAKGSFDRSLSWWIRDVLNREAAAIEKGIPNAANAQPEGETVSVEDVPSHRSRVGVES